MHTISTLPALFDTATTERSALSLRASRRHALLVAIEEQNTSPRGAGRRRPRRRRP